MGHCYMGNSGGVALNFRVVAYSTESEMSSATPRDNTMGIVTDTKITEWIISKAAPENPTAGMLWIETGETSLGQVDVLKTNSIIICPIAAHQYTAGGWVDRVGKTFRGTWIAWEPEAVYLFRPGNQCTDITGGWNGIDAAAEKLYKYLSIQTDESAWTYTTTEKLVDLTEYGLLSVTVDEYHSNFQVLLLDSSGKQKAVVSAQSPGIVKMNLAGISGSFYIRLYSDSHNSGGWASTSFAVSEVKLLKAEY